MDGFTGFTTETLPLLAELGRFTRSDYADRKAEIVEHLQEPAKAFVDAMVPALRSAISAGFQGTPKINGSISPLNSDLRFAKPGTPPYKDHLLVWFWDGDSKKTAPLVAVRIHPDGIGFGAGMGFAGARLDRWRAAVDGDAGEEIAAMVGRLARNDVDVAGEQLKRVPKPFPPDHPRGDLLRYKSIQVRFQEPVPTSFTSARFVGWCTTRAARLEPLHRVLVEEVA